ncbi:TIR domain-containing protein (plasmid) [Rhizobium sp. N113]|nr:MULTISPECIES: toll/interleukin-1 receptor domain-containing protein [Rhizobium]ANL24348.1 TIR domain-containing protein [Rhizobium sp. N113]UWU38969.1 toll/interleukin-1 receptor domain-containing protein [Rhizobium leguminosarum bv. phaseoli]
MFSLSSDRIGDVSVTNADSVIANSSVASDAVRESIFISHATPEDNAFTLWLGNRLDAMGYDVWADIFRLKGGDNWEVVLEDAIRHRAGKVLVVSNPVSIAKQGVRNEISIALTTGKGIKDDSFVIPLRTAEYESSFQMVHAQRVDFMGGWAQGLRDLIETLEGAGIPRRGASERSRIWREISLRDGQSVVETGEKLISNWLRVKALPRDLRIYDFAGGISIGAKDRAIKSCPLPVVPLGRGFLTFASPPALHEHFGDSLPMSIAGIVETEEFLTRGAPGYRIDANDARRHVVDLMRQGFDRRLGQAGLQATEMASGRYMWWPDKNAAGVEQKAFSWKDGLSGRRQLVGQSKARNVFWHYGVSAWPATAPFRHFRLSGHVIFTVDGRSTVGDAKRMHTMRRTMCKSWRNDRWRDLMLAYLGWLVGDATELSIDMGGDAFMALEVPPVQFDVSFGLEAEATAAEEHEDEETGDILASSDDEAGFDDENDFDIPGDEE